MAEKDEKAARLAAALRENLRRRKAQARAVDAPPAPREGPRPQAQAASQQAGNPKQPAAAKAAKASDEEWWTE